MRKWNGKDKSGRYQYPLDQVETWDMTIDEEGTIYYMTKEIQSKQKVWCSANRLSQHLHHILIQLPAR